MVRPSEGDTTEGTVVTIDSDSQAFLEEFNAWSVRLHTCDCVFTMHLFLPLCSLPNTDAAGFVTATILV